MSYDQDYDFPGSDPVLEDDRWLEDLKSMLDETPTNAHPAGSHSGQQSRQQSCREPAAQYHSEPRQQYRPDFRQQNLQGMEELYTAPRSGRGAQPAYGGTPYQASRSRQAQSCPPVREEQPRKARRQKHPYASIIALSVIILLECAGIAAVAVQWITWMR